MHAFAGTLSPDGRRLTYAVPRGDGQSSNLFVRDVAGGKPRLIGEAYSYAWSPDGARLAAAGDKALLLLDVRSGKRRELTRGELGRVSFAPDGKALAYARGNGRVGREFRSDIFVIRLADGEITRLTHDGHGDLPAWGPEWIAYRRFRFSGDWSIGEVRLMRPDGSGQRLFARGDERMPPVHLGLDTLGFSADGKRLLACAATEFFCTPVTLTVPGGEKHQLSVGKGLVTQAAGLSRDGSEVLVEAGPFDGPTNVYAIPFAGGKPRLLVRDAASPSWAR